MEPSATAIMGSLFAPGFDSICSNTSALGADATIEAVLRHAGQTFMNSTGGAMGAIFGRMLIAGGKALRGCASIGPAEFHIMLAAMETAVSTAGKAVPGDKTILDAIHAAAAAEPQSTMGESLRLAARQASLAAAATASMICRVGRASRLAERAIGHPDPGAVSFSFFLEALAGWFDPGALELSIESAPDVVHRRCLAGDQDR
jgi:dihydroxyacetone kinase